MSALNATYPSANTTVSTGRVAALYHRCGGINWDGATDCEAGSYCKVQNPFYSQCVAIDGSYTNATATGSNVDYINTLLASGSASARPTTLVTITASSSSAPAVATPTGTAADDDDYCDDEPTVTSSISFRPTASAAAAADDEGDYCEDEETLTVSVTSRPTATAAAVADDGDDYCED
ncbi:hypothetical protein J7T55_004565 [Diaporthe amygdali]|uniref:uncharacterized protein n=1 Tax=Phomopsis amygdali TaxID=1214568 RepID=UPI0022FEE218|nr:uncharacterized protein J7T55_004565 [Diaporthe amygdali]KAJ0114823.1 hypothetical protein J7T55_004565 [Diaporthe amygdali]